MSRGNVIDRARLRKKPLLDMCKNRPDIICRNEYGEAYDDVESCGVARV